MNKGCGRSMLAGLVAVTLMLCACSDDADVKDDSLTPGGTSRTNTTISGDNPDRGDTRPIDSAIAPDTAAGNAPATGGASGP